MKIVEFENTGIFVRKYFACWISTEPVTTDSYYKIIGVQRTGKYVYVNQDELVRFRKKLDISILAMGMERSEIDKKGIGVIYKFRGVEFTDSIRIYLLNRPDYYIGEMYKSKIHIPGYPVHDTAAIWPVIYKNLDI